MVTSNQGLNISEIQPALVQKFGSEGVDLLRTILETNLPSSEEQGFAMQGSGSETLYRHRYITTDGDSILINSNTEKTYEILFDRSSSNGGEFRILALGDSNRFSGDPTLALRAAFERGDSNNVFLKSIAYIHENKSLVTATPGDPIFNNMAAFIDGVLNASSQANLATTTAPGVTPDHAVTSPGSPAAASSTSAAPAVTLRDILAGEVETPNLRLEDLYPAAGSRAATASAAATSQPPELPVQPVPEVPMESPTASGSPTPNPLGSPGQTGTPITVTPPPAAQSPDLQQGLSMDRLTSSISLGASLGGQFVQNLELREVGALFNQIGGVPEGQDILANVMRLSSNTESIQNSLQALEARVDGATEAIDGKLADAQGLLEMANRNRDTLQSDRFANMLQAGLGSLATDPTLNTLAGFAKRASETADSIPDASLRSAVKGLNGPSRLLDVLDSLSNLEDSSVAAAIFASRAQGNDPDPILLTNELIRNLREGINKYQSEGPSSAITYLVQSGTLHKFNNLADVLIERGDDYQVELRP